MNNVLIETSAPGGKMASLKKVIWPNDMRLHSAVNQIPRASLVFTLIKEQINDDAFSRVAVGNEIQIFYSNEVAKTLLFRGVITQQNFREVGDQAHSLSLVVTCRHPLFRLQNRIRSQLFTAKTDQAILTTLLTGIKHSLQESSLKVKHEQMIQLKCSDWEFLRARVRANHVWMFPTPEGVDIRQPKAATSGLALPGSAFSAEWEFNYPAALSGVNVSAWDISKQTPSEQKAVSSPLGTLGNHSPHPSTSPEAWNVAYPAPLSPPEMTALAQAASQNKEATKVRTKCECDIQPTLRLGDTVTIGGKSALLRGSAIVTEITHSFTGPERRQTEVVTGLDADTPIISDLTPRIEGLYIGLVHDIVKDDTGAHRIQVTIPALGVTTNTPLWARFSQPYASTESGICFFPEKLDEVILGFFDNDPRYPVVLGSMHNPKKVAPIAYETHNEQRGFVFKQKEQLQSLIFDRKKNTVTLINNLHEKSDTQKIELDATNMTFGFDNVKSNDKRQFLHFNAGGDALSGELHNFYKDVGEQSLLFDAKKNSVDLVNNDNQSVKQSLNFNANKEKMTLGFNNTQVSAAAQSLLLDAKHFSVALKNVHEKTLTQSLLFDASNKALELGNTMDTGSGQQILKFKIDDKASKATLNNISPSKGQQSLSFSGDDKEDLSSLLNKTSKGDTQQLDFTSISDKNWLISLQTSKAEKKEHGIQIGIGDKKTLLSLWQGNVSVNTATYNLNATTLAMLQNGPNNTFKLEGSNATIQSGTVNIGKNVNMG